MGKIGVLDSGIGGMVMLQELMKRYPLQDFIFLADQIHSPYGSKTNEELIEIVNRNMAWLKQKGATSLLFACNTISCLDAQKLDSSLPVQRVIEPTCRQIESLNVHTVIVCATPFTCRTNAYEVELKKMNPDLKVITMPLPYLCRDLEEMKDPDSILEKLKQDFKETGSKADALILGCTHYPLAKSLFQQIFDGIIIDSDGIALENTEEGQGKVEYYTTDDTAYFDQQCKSLFHLTLQSMKAEI